MKIHTGGGCKFCATHGIDLAGPSKVYVITHREWQAVKIGIGACTGYTSRLIQHERQGWQLHQAREYATGAAAYDVEQAVLDRLRQAGLIPFLTSDVMPNGWTETCSAARVTAAEVWAMVDEETRNSAGPYAPRVGDRPCRGPHRRGGRSRRNAGLRIRTTRSVSRPHQRDLALALHDLRARGTSDVQRRP
ncbi:hypothetical protein [Streptomyces avermitilis]|uniref:hypothetical protein n=1 Tax=Streptomyces avermitilis TaxID=33903 RepID=UPI0033A2736E